MLYPEREITLKDGRRAVFRSPREGDAAEMLEYLRTCAAETPYILMYP